MSQMRVLLIDADSTIPNLALMKLCKYYKQKHWARVELLKLNIPYYPDRKKQYVQVDTSPYDLCFCSVVFEGSAEYVCGSNIIFGGTGVTPMVYLPKEIDDCEPDYSLYSKEFVNDTSYGFISRGCIRKCSFCKVHVVEGGIVQVSDISSIVKHSKVKFMDNNFLALPNHEEILEELIAKRIKCQFNQGLDIRLVTERNSNLLSKLYYFGEYIFAFDDVKYQNVIERQLQLLSWRRPFQFKFFVYVHPDMPINDTIHRIKWLKEHECLPYIMRDVACWESEFNHFYVDIAAYCNQVFAFKKLDFEGFLRRRYTNKYDHVNEVRVASSLKVWNDNK